MSMLDTLRDDMKTAMRAGDKERLGVIRLVLAAVKQREVDDRTTLDDGAVQALIEKMIKQRRDSIEQFSAGGRDDLAEKERSEVTVLESYLPEALDEAQIDALVAAAVASTGAASMRDMGRVMGEVKSKASGRLDMALASELVKRRLSGG
jgi:uncharacterized protein YqeY